MSIYIYMYIYIHTYIHRCSKILNLETLEVCYISCLHLGSSTFGEFANSIHHPPAMLWKCGSRTLKVHNFCTIDETQGQTDG